MTMDFDDPHAIERHAELIARTLDERPKVSSLWLLLAVWALAGLLLTLALRTGEDWLYGLGLALTAAWTVGFVLARGEARWFRW